MKLRYGEIARMQRIVRTLGAVCVLITAATLAACGGDDDDGGGSGTCDAVCACVVAEGNVQASCELKLEGYGYPQCKSKCVGFPTS